MTRLASIPAPKPRISAKVRRALELRVREGLSIRAAAHKGAGMSEQGFHKALKRPAVRDALQEIQARFVAEVEASRALYKARAFEVALDLMLNAKSETVRARMAEFLASDGKPGTSVSALGIEQVLALARAQPVAPRQPVQQEAGMRGIGGNIGLDRGEPRGALAALFGLARGLGMPAKHRDGQIGQMRRPSRRQFRGQVTVHFAGQQAGISSQQGQFGLRRSLSLAMPSGSLSSGARRSRSLAMSRKPGSRSTCWQGRSSNPG